MVRWGAAGPEMGPMEEEAVFRARVKLLLVMVRAFLKDYPLGRHRRAAMVENARFVFYHALKRNGRGPVPPDREDHLEMQRIQLLAVMVQSLAEGNPMGDYRRKAIEANVNWLAGRYSGLARASEMAFLKVA